MGTIGLVYGAFGALVAAGAYRDLRGASPPVSRLESVGAAAIVGALWLPCWIVGVSWGWSRFPR